MQKNQFLLLFLIILQSCQSDLLTDNKTIIEKIDKLNFSKTIYEVSIDNNEKVIDTLSIEKVKTDANGNVRYEIKEFLSENEKTIKQSYYRSNEDLFFGLTDYERKDFEFYTQYETFVNNKDIIEKAQMINFDSNERDTVFMKYNYSYNSKGKRETLSITYPSDSTNSIYFMKYNDNEKSDFTYLIINNDTIEKSSMKYQNGNISESTHEFKEPFRIDIYSYDDNKNVKSRKVFKRVNDSLKMSMEYIYENNDLGNPEKIIIKDLENDTIMKRRLITAHNKDVYKK